MKDIVLSQTGMTSIYCMFLLLFLSSQHVLHNNTIFEAIKEALLNEGIIKKLADSVLNAILSSHEIITNIVESITEKIQEDVSQQLYQSLFVEIDNNRHVLTF